MKRYVDCTAEAESDCQICPRRNGNDDCCGNPINQVAFLRMQAKISKDQLAEAIHKTRAYVSMIERGAQPIIKVTFGTVLLMAKELGIDDLTELLSPEEKIEYL